MSRALGNYRELVVKVDRFVVDVEDKYRDSMDCRRGCSDCCMTRPTVTQIEAAAVSAHVDAMEPGARTELRDHVRDYGADTSRCAALDPSGSCLIYEARPLVCRSHGVPIRMATPTTARRADGLAVVEVCHRNFTGDVGLAEVDPGAVLDQTTLSTVLAAVEQAHCQELGIEPKRLELVALLTE